MTASQPDKPNQPDPTPEAVPPPKDDKTILVEWYWNHSKCGELDFVERPPATILPDDRLAPLLQSPMCNFANSPDRGLVFRIKTDENPCPLYQWVDDSERVVALDRFQEKYLVALEENSKGWVGLDNLLRDSELTFVQFNTLIHDGLIKDFRTYNHGIGERRINFLPIKSQ